jgi:TonB-dependent starch-binding outer membrane protein SusC
MIRSYFLIAVLIFAGNWRATAQRLDTLPQVRPVVKSLIHYVPDDHRFPEPIFAICGDPYFPPVITDLVGTQLKAKHFHQGVFYNWHQLWQGRTAGFTAVRPGSNPNQAFDIRARGLHSMNLSADPLIVVDGLPGVSMQSLDPTDIAEVNILRDGVGMARYGARGSAGVIEVKTHAALDDRKHFKLQYRPEVGFDFAEKLYQVPDKQFFTMLGGKDINPTADYETNWQQEVIRPVGINTAHHLTIAGRYHRDGVVQARIHYRNQQGILRGSQFDQLTGYLGVAQSLFQRKVQLKAGLHLAQNRANLGFMEAYRYAVVANPTAEVKNNDPINQSNGGYVALGNNVFNPVAMIQRNINSKDVTYSMVHLNASWKIHPTLQMEVYSAFEREVTSRLLDLKLQRVGQLFFTQNYNERFNNKQGVVDAHIKYDKTWEKTNLSATLGNTLQIRNNTSLLQSDSTRYASLYGQVAANYNKMVFLSAGMRYEGASQLGPDARRGVFPYVEMGFDFAPVIRQSAISQLRLSASQATSGQATPLDNLWQGNAASIFDLRYTLEPLIFQPLLINTNTHFGFERHTERALQLDAMLGHRYHLQMVVYKSVSSDLTTLQFAPPEIGRTVATYNNVGQLSNRGAELTLNMRAISNTNFSWDIGFVAHHNHTTITHLPFADTLRIGALNNASTSGGYDHHVNRLYNGVALGQYYGQVALSGQVQYGELVIKDLNGDGLVIGSDDRDKRELTNAQPLMEWGLHQQFRWGNWQAGLSLRSVIGHRMVNEMRYRYSRPPVFEDNINCVLTDYFDKNLIFPYRFSDYFIEKASFLRVQNVHITWQHPNQKWSVTLGANNLFTWTKYSGLDPELRLSDVGPNDTYGLDFSTTNLVTGVDRLNSIPAVRSVFLTVGFRM